MNQDDLENIARQLSKPEGEAGIQIADMMNSTNILMTSDSIDALQLTDNVSVLEIGHGNCGHLKYFLNKGNNIKYTGLEISSLMSDQAKEINKNLLNKNIEFTIYDGINIPFKEENFDSVFTVNTIYFWKEPLHFLKEIYRILKPNGTFVITFADKTFMQKLPFTQYVFTLYAMEEVEKLSQNAGFGVTSIKENTDQVTSKTGEHVTRKFYTLTLNK